MSANRTYQSFGTGDVIATFNGIVIAELLSITWSVEREKAPNYVLGQVNPVGYARGRRGIAGSLVFAVFNRNALMSAMRNADESTAGPDWRDVNYYYDFRGSTSDNAEDFRGLGTWYQNSSSRPSRDQVNAFLQNAISNNTSLVENAGRISKVDYADQLQSFDIVLNYANEAGYKAKTTLRDVEILNQGSGISIQDLATSHNYTFVARDIEEMTAMTDTGGRDDDFELIDDDGNFYA